MSFRALSAAKVCEVMTWHHGCGNGQLLPDRVVDGIATFKITKFLWKRKRHLNRQLPHPCIWRLDITKSSEQVPDQGLTGMLTWTKLKRGFWPWTSRNPVLIWDKISLSCEKIVPGMFGFPSAPLQTWNQGTGRRGKEDLIASFTIITSHHKTCLYCLQQESFK